MVLIIKEAGLRLTQLDVHVLRELDTVRLVTPTANCGTATKNPLQPEKHFPP